MLAEKLSHIDLLQAQIGQAGPLTADRKKQLDFKFRLDWNYFSNANEGGTLTMIETRSLMVGNVEINGKPLKDVLEMRGHDEVVREILKLGRNEARLSEKRIKDIHRAIIHEMDPEKKSLIGIWKQVPNHIIITTQGEKNDFLPPSEVPAAIHDLLNRTNADLDAIMAKKNDAPHPAWVAFRFQLDYLAIHPFYDGNGRTARIFTNLLLIAAGFPPLIIKTTQKDTYNQLLTEIQTSGAPAELFYEFLADRLLDSQKLVLATLAGRAIEDPDDLDKEIDFFKRNLQDKERIEARKEAKTVREILTNSFVPLAKALIVKLAQFDELFLGSQRFLDHDYPAHPYYYYWDYLDEQRIAISEFDESAGYCQGWVRKEENGLMITDTISEFWLYYKLWEYKYGPEYQLYVKLYAYFKDYNVQYTCQINDQTLALTETRYGVHLTEEQVREQVSTIIREVISELKKVGSST